MPSAGRRKLHDPSVLIEEYFYYADIQREQERQGIDPEQRAQLARSASRQILSDVQSSNRLVDKGGFGSVDDKDNVLPEVSGTEEGTVSDEDWENAARAFRNASWISM
jgi:hypothetical protein